METDDVRVVALGTVLWVIALVATLVFHDRLADQGNDDWVWIALAGVFLGFVGLRHVRRRRRLPTPDVEHPAPRGTDGTGTSSA